MKGNIYLVRTHHQKTVPALCLETQANFMIVVQIRTANDEDIFNIQDRAKMEKYNQGKKVKDQIKIREKYEIKTIYIGQPQGLKSKSVVMVNRLHKIKMEQIIKHIAQVSDEIVIKCINLIEDLRRISELQKELQLLKKKVQLAQLNNERYQEYELRIDKIVREIGYQSIKRRNKRPFLNYREVPTKGHIKIYNGGR